MSANILHLPVTKVFEKVQMLLTSTHLCSDFIATYEQQDLQCLPDLRSPLTIMTGRLLPRDHRSDTFCLIKQSPITLRGHIVHPFC